MRYVLSALMVLIHLATSYMGLELDLPYALNAVLILSIGLLHGSNDLLIYQKVTGTRWKILGLYYALVTSIFLLLYLISPLACLTAFVIVSAFHFGEEMNELDHFKKSLVHFLISGMLVFCLMFYFNFEEFAAVVLDLSEFAFAKATMLYALLTSCIIYIIFSMYQISGDRSKGIKFISQWIGLSFLAVAFYQTDLFTSFTIFFVFWHSLPSVRNQMAHVYQRKDDFLRYLKDAAPIYVVSLTGVLIGCYFFYEQELFSRFALLAAIIVTVPHIIIIYRLYKNGQTS